MRRGRSYTTSLCLTDIEHFFVRPNLSPFSADYHNYSFTAGIEYIASELRTRSAVSEVRVTLYLPAASIQPGLEQRVEAALQRYCQSRIQEIELEACVLSRRALHAMLAALIVLVVFIGLGTQLTASPIFLLQVIGDGLSIIGWVFVWFPLDTFLFSVRYARQDQRIYRTLMHMHISIGEA
ncbi:hypothetical protein [Dictyobacter arantiisoli]|uniref:Uncharacterized protein n=1 Tax=Dictyobacter arantiisoli TaxID=2014874 RepID=A0A5A5TIK9_9CHLR|nr:hypothetical protein [Dictyobacter arantiisoli]GCF10784.1 hypothetical protein KDI_43480 [Dictyobacter arantiisoli]